MHQSNLAVGKGINVAGMQPVITLIQDIRNYFSGKSTKRAIKLADICSNLSDMAELCQSWSGIDQKSRVRRLQKYVPTRWGSFFGASSRLALLSQQCKIVLARDAKSADSADSKEREKAADLLSNLSRWEGIIVFLADFGELYKNIITVGQTVHRPWIHLSFHIFYDFFAILFDSFREPKTSAD